MVNRLWARGTLIAATALLLGGCSATNGGSSDGDVPPTLTVTETRGGSDGRGTPSPTLSDTSEPGTAPTNPSATCNNNPADSAFGRFLEQGRIPLGTLGAGPGDVIAEPDDYIYFQIKDNGYDSCADLSYVVIEGSNGSGQGPAGTGSSMAEAVVLFHNGELITNPAPFEMREVTAVSRSGDGDIDVVFGHAGGATAEGVTEHYRFTFFYDDGLSARGQLPDTVDGHMRLYLL
ncbi:LppP/LprE family lipoprotein [Corynebacterium pacaense]|uniref:LppP/LprE family lipoprotein n=1 Tax=Corynebacterium pacaense TaxID=1816684 RepID=UPI0009BBC064|nr:LppP/LprE family lipoprotein [Corynebacterium pacaense]